MTVKGKIEEAGEMFDNETMTKKGRKMRNAGRIKSGKAPKATPPGSGN
ncbi:MAG: hypothetical protein K2Q01_02655 [Rickettsiales bacterium]|nr:hypothetical protein [Rickettsiales bacterium]